MNQNHLCSKHKELDIHIIVDLFFGSQKRCSLRGRSSAATAMHELIPPVLVDQLSGVLFWSFSKSPGECCPVWGHPLDAGFLFCYLEVCQTTGEKSEGRNRCSRKLPDPKIFRHTTLPGHRKANFRNIWQLKWFFFSCHTGLAVAAKYFFF